MTVAMLDRVSARTREIHPGRVLLTALAAVLFAVGWLAARTVTALVAAALWTAAAVSVGWHDARPRRDGESEPTPRIRLAA